MSEDNLPAVIEVPEDPIPFDEDPEAAKLWAREVWWNGSLTVKQIASAIEVPLHKINNWIHGSRTKPGWKKQKDKQDEGTIKRHVLAQQKRIHRILEKMITILEDSAEHIIDNRIKLNVGEFRAFASSFETLFKVRQLIIGSPTEIYGFTDNKHMTWDDVLEEIKKVDVVQWDGKKLDA